MVKTASTMLTLGTGAPDFQLPGTNGAVVSRTDFAGKPLLVIFMCNHCPFVKHLADHLASATRQWMEQGVAVVGISSNDVVAYPQDNLDAMKVEAAERGYEFPYLLDETQEVAKAYRAACTPDFFLFDAGHQLVYRGQYDDSRPSNGVAVTGADLQQAVQAVLGQGEMSAEQKPSIGCNIKWKGGAEPDYFNPQGVQ
ncbi:MAG: thioredoxin family protein [Planctomycetales bacterium]|nr:thioredoxin family protein [Planctomycetales bacterium]